MSLERKSEELKALVATYETQWFLGLLSGMMRNIGTGRANDQIGNLSSPQRQLYYLAGLLISSNPTEESDFIFKHEKWGTIVQLLNDIEKEYDQLFTPRPSEIVDEEWRKIRRVAVPSFLSYFNQGPLNYEEQTINWVSDLYTQFDNTIETATGLLTADFINFYNNLDRLNQSNFQSLSKRNGSRKDWKRYTKIEMGVLDGVPDFVKEMGEKMQPFYTFLSDHGIIDRFLPEELVSQNLSIDKVKRIIGLLVIDRSEANFLYYTETKPGNPMFTKPIVNIGNDLYQVFEVKQVIHAIDELLTAICSSNQTDITSLVKRKGVLLENKIILLFKRLFKKDYEIYTGYFVDGCEQDILFLWKDFAFIIEAKGYNLREPFRDPNRAYIRIKDDFNSCIGYAYKQTHRVEEKFTEQLPLRITDNQGNLIKEIDTTLYDSNDFSIIVNLESFGQIQNDLSHLLAIDEDDAYPWAVKFDDLEVFILTLLAKKKKPQDLIDFLSLREAMHTKLICADELEICGAFLLGKFNADRIDALRVIITKPEYAFLFDEQYNRVMGFKNEKYVREKLSGKTIFW